MLCRCSMAVDNGNARLLTGKGQDGTISWSELDDLSQSRRYVSDSAMRVTGTQVHSIHSKLMCFYVLNDYDIIVSLFRDMFDFAPFFPF